MLYRVKSMVEYMEEFYADPVIPDEDGEMTGAEDAYVAEMDDQNDLAFETRLLGAV